MVDHFKTLLFAGKNMGFGNEILPGTKIIDRCLDTSHLFEDGVRIHVEDRERFENKADELFDKYHDAVVSSEKILDRQYGDQEFEAKVLEAFLRGVCGIREPLNQQDFEEPDFNQPEVDRVYLADLLDESKYNCAIASLEQGAIASKAAPKFDSIEVKPTVNLYSRSEESHAWCEVHHNYKEFRSPIILDPTHGYFGPPEENPERNRQGFRSDADENLDYTGRTEIGFYDLWYG